MKVVSSKTGSSRERVDAEADLLDIANWRIILGDADTQGFVRAKGRHLVLSSRWGAERTSELRLTEAEAIAIAKAVADDLFDAASRATHSSHMRGTP